MMSMLIVQMYIILFQLLQQLYGCRLLLLRKINKVTIGINLTLAVFILNGTQLYCLRLEFPPVPLVCPTFQQSFGQDKGTDTSLLVQPFWYPSWE